MQQEMKEFVFTPPGPGAVNITRHIVDWIRHTEIATGLLTLHVRHTSASLMIQENADPTVMEDMERFLRRLAPHGDPIFDHTDEGPDDMPAHVRSALTSTTLSVPVAGGRPTLGTWQGIFLWEHRFAPHTRRVIITVQGS